MIARAATPGQDEMRACDPAEQHRAGQVPAVAWHALSASEAASRQVVETAIGLQTGDVGARRAHYGENRLASTPPRSKWLAFLDQFKSLLILVLIGAAALAGAIGDLKDAVVILVVVLFNALLGFWQEHRAEATLAALKKMLSPTARVRRDGRVEEIPAAQLVPGDIVLLEAGNRVPADGRLLAAHNVEIDEAALTGESHPAGKDARAPVAAEAPLAERVNMAYMNTVLTRGRAELLVTGTGMATEMGRLAGMLAEAEAGPTPLQIQLDALGRRLALIAGVVIALIFVLGVLRGEPLVEIVLTSIALAVAAIPEGLPAVVTVTLALGMHRMAQHRAIVKKLAAVETLGCTTVICSDKTGTLTLNQMTARAVAYRGRRFAISGEGYGASGEIVAEDGGERPDFAPLLYPAALANDSRIRDGALIGDPTEGALLALAAKGGVDAERLAAHCPRIAEIPFDSAHKFQASFHHEGEFVRMYLKGAPDVLLARATRHLAAAGEAALDEGGRAWWIAENERLAAQAMRVLALAEKTLPARDFDPEGDLMAQAHGLSFVGLAGIMDPPRPEAREAIALCKKAGIAVKMITGDHRITAAAIARDLGLEGEVIEGRELDGMDAPALAARIERIAVFARVAPEHKVRIVQALKAGGHVTAMTGDGVNDAPALKHADIGVAMGIAGTEVTKEAATMVLTDDNFATIVRAVREGRAIYDNIVKFVRFQLSTNMGAIQTVLGASLLGWATPFTAIQILWINIIMDGPPAMSLGVEPSRPGVMDEPPRPREARILTGRRLAQLFVYGFTMAVGTLALFHYAKPQGEAYALTLAFTTFVLFQFFNLFNARAEHGSAFNRHFFRNRWLWLSLAAVLALQALVVHWAPAQAIFRTTDLALADWALAAAVASGVLLLDEGRKLALRLTGRDARQASADEPRSTSWVKRRHAVKADTGTQKE
ncbi:cation-translocating P-type ATPase [uncultured Ralstonia sp.]|uniref:cation-translocating P-type ATPase n=1 Tax=uncultured Ralstonia sp. TaxID=114715 RepID=UPI002615C995|nr:cation-translocating P-type ATPase [uncultured Ralstonia sp.]